MSDDILSFTVPGPPMPKERPRASVRKGKVVMYTPKKTAAYEKAVRGAAQHAVAMWLESVGCEWPPDKTRFSVSVAFFMADRRVRDLDNCLKSVTDGMNKVAFPDDYLIDELHVTRGYDKENPRAVIAVKAIR